jgi:lipopolysaccharide export LptBFGC system permease protein LptF
MSIKLDRKFVKKTLDEEDSGDEDSMIELGQIAILSSSKASLRYKSATKLNELSASQRFQESLKRKEITKRKDDENNKLIGCDDDDEDLKKLKIKDKDQNRPEELQSDDKEIEILEPDTWLENLKEQLLMFKGYGFGVLSGIYNQSKFNLSI